MFVLIRSGPWLETSLRFFCLPSRYWGSLTNFWLPSAPYSEPTPSLARQEGDGLYPEGS